MLQKEGLNPVEEVLPDQDAGRRGCLIPGFLGGSRHKEAFALHQRCFLSENEVAIRNLHSETFVFNVPDLMKYGSVMSRWGGLSI